MFNDLFDLTIDNRLRNTIEYKNYKYNVETRELNLLTSDFNYLELVWG